MFKCSIVILISMGTIATTFLTPQILVQARQKTKKVCVDPQPVAQRVGLTLKADKKVVKDNKTIFEPIVGKASVRPGDVIKYTVIARNNSRCPLKNLILKQPIPKGTTYLKDSAKSMDGAELLFSIDGGKTFSAKPIVGTQEVPATEYNYLRWRFAGRMPTNTQVQTTYKLQVK